MFQDFGDKTDPSLGAPRLAALRAQLAALGLSGFIVPHADRFQGEYLQARDERLMWLTGFSGSAGAAVVLAENAAVFVDGRYTLQAAAQIDGDAFSHQELVGGALTGWLEKNAGEGTAVGYDPWLHTAAAANKLRRACTKAGAALQPVEPNPIDTIWPDQPAPPSARIVPHALEFAGKSAAEKLVQLREALADAGEDASLVTLCDGISWLFNIRGNDVVHTPIVHAFALVQKNCATLFTDPGKLDDAARDWLAPHAMISPETDLGPALDALGAAGATVRLDPDTAADWLALRLKAAGAKVSKAGDPTIGPKARKNAAERAGAHAAHARDGVAMARFLAWFDDKAPAGDLDEIAAATQLERLRAETNQLRDISFDTISAAGPNAALPHYRVSSASNRIIEPGSFYLVDSGGQYRDGTTDITRTIAVGKVPGEMKRRYTQVLRGHIAIATARFPVGTCGAQLDTLARLPLWLAGEDFDHGTGHGVGAYLSVHEGPQRISKAGTAVLEPGMILSNEPGFYKEGVFGIRIENLILVTEATDIPGGSRPMMGFETLSYTPIDTSPLDSELMAPDEIAWLNAYHAETRMRLIDQLQGPDRDWLIAATEPI
ncbi:Xaa-Pro aminopeptidase [hydrothermal vent metagenome]|uniref:Xaa-Pro aminopeptidase n=1 Tax=hydrothermal vent metagenome TaxID=652676 RepID=A0A3B0TA85_9ZZZZ